VQQAGRPRSTREQNLRSAPRGWQLRDALGRTTMVGPGSAAFARPGPRRTVWPTPHWVRKTSN